MELKRCVSVRDASGAFNPSYNEEERMTVRAENILMAVGQRWICPSSVKNIRWL